MDQGSGSSGGAANRHSIISHVRQIFRSGREETDRSIDGRTAAGGGKERDNRISAVVTNFNSAERIQPGLIHKRRALGCFKEQVGRSAAHSERTFPRSY